MPTLKTIKPGATEETQLTLEEAAKVLHMHEALLRKVFNEAGYKGTISIEQFKDLMAKTGLSYADADYSFWGRLALKSTDAKSAVRKLLGAEESKEGLAKAEYINKKVEGSMLAWLIARKAFEKGGLKGEKLDEEAQQFLARRANLEVEYSVFDGRKMKTQSQSFSEFLGKAWMGVELLDERFPDKGVDRLLDDFIDAMVARVGSASDKNELTEKMIKRSASGLTMDALVLALAAECGSIIHKNKEYRPTEKDNLLTHAEMIQAKMNGLKADLVAAAKSADPKFGAKIEAKLSDEDAVSDFMGYFGGNYLLTEFLRGRSPEFSNHIIDFSMNRYLLGTAARYAYGSGKKELVDRVLLHHSSLYDKLITISIHDYNEYKAIGAEFIKAVFSDPANLDKTLNSITDMAVYGYAKALDPGKKVFKERPTKDQQGLLMGFAPGRIVEYTKAGKEGELKEALSMSLAYLGFNAGDMEDIKSGRYDKLAEKFAGSKFYAKMREKGFRGEDDRPLLGAAISSIGIFSRMVLDKSPAEANAIMDKMADIPNKDAILAEFRGSKEQRGKAIAENVWGQIRTNVYTIRKGEGSLERYTLGAEGEIEYTESARKDIKEMLGFDVAWIKDRTKVLSRRESDAMLQTEIGKALMGKVKDEQAVLSIIADLARNVPALIDAGIGAEKIRNWVGAYVAKKQDGDMRNILNDMYAGFAPKRAEEDKAPAKTGEEAKYTHPLTKSVRYLTERLAAANVKELEEAKKAGYRGRGYPKISGIPTFSVIGPLSSQKDLEELRALYNDIVEGLKTGKIPSSDKEGELKFLSGAYNKKKANIKWPVKVRGKYNQNDATIYEALQRWFGDYLKVQPGKSEKSYLGLVETKKGKFTVYFEAGYDGRAGWETLKGIEQALIREVPVPVEVQPMPKQPEGARPFKAPVVGKTTLKKGPAGPVAGEEDEGGFDFVTIIPTLTGRYMPVVSKEIKTEQVTIPTTTFTFSSAVQIGRLDHPAELNSILGYYGLGTSDLSNNDLLAANLQSFIVGPFSQQPVVIDAAKAGTGTIYTYIPSGSTTPITTKTAPPPGVSNIKVEIKGTNFDTYVDGQLVGSGTVSYNETTGTLTFEQTTKYGPIYVALNNVANFDLGEGVNLQFGALGEFIVPYGDRLPKSLAVKAFNIYPSASLTKMFDLGDDYYATLEATGMLAKGGKGYFMPGARLEKSFGGDTFKVRIGGGAGARLDTGKLLPTADLDFVFWDALDIGGSIGSQLVQARMLVYGYGAGATFAGPMIVPSIYLDGQDVVGKFVKGGANLIYNQGIMGEKPVKTKW